MKSKILVVGFTCLSFVAVAQSNGQGQSAKTSDVRVAREASSGQATGRHMNKKAGNETGTQPAGTARETPSPKATSKIMVQDDWQAKSAATSTTPKVTNVSTADVNADGAADRTKTPPATKGQVRVAVGDVNGDGKADVAASPTSGTATGQNAAINNSHSNIKSPRDLATGQASGKRVHSDITITKYSDKATPKN